MQTKAKKPLKSLNLLTNFSYITLIIDLLIDRYKIMCVEAYYNFRRKFSMMNQS